MHEIIWNEATYTTGHHLIDDQHQTIVSLYNSLAKLSQQDKISPTECGRILLALHQQLHSHFSIEESLFLQHQHRLYREHHQNHHKLIKILDLYLEKRDVSKLGLLVEQLYYWFNIHLENECAMIRRVAAA